MFDNIFAAIEKWMRELLTGMVESNMSTMFTDVNEKTSEIAAQVGRTPQNWNSSVFSMIQNLSESVVVPIAGIIITLVLCYELISMLTERNNLHDVDTWMFFKYFAGADNSHTGRPSGIFSDVRAAGENDLTFFAVCGRRTLRGF